MSLTGNNIAVALTRYNVPQPVARLAGQYLDDQWWMPSQVRTALRVHGVESTGIAEAIEAAELELRAQGRL